MGPWLWSWTRDERLVFQLLSKFRPPSNVVRSVFFLQHKDVLARFERRFHMEWTSISGLILGSSVPVHAEKPMRCLRHTYVGNTCNTSRIPQTQRIGCVPRPHTHVVQLLGLCPLWDNVDGFDSVHLDTFHDLILRSCLHDDPDSTVPHGFGKPLHQ